MKKNQINLQYTTIKTPVPDFIYEGLREFSGNANIYRSQPTELIHLLAKKHNVPTEMIFLTVGIDEAIQIFAHAYGKNAYTFIPTYSVYADVEMFGGKLNRINAISNNVYTVPIKRYGDATLIYLANPNNPSGFTSKEDVMKLVTLNDHAIVCVDEAYGAFGNLLVDDQVQQHKNMVVFRSFSKDYGMAGNRIGYIIAHPGIINNVKNYSQWANVSYLSVGAAITALQNENYYEKMRSDINDRRDTFIQFLKTKNFSVFPSHINASLIKFISEEKANTFVEYLKNYNVVVSHGNGASNIGLDKSFVRIAIGTEDQMKTVKQIITKYL